MIYRVICVTPRSGTHPSNRINTLHCDIMSSGQVHMQYEAAIQRIQEGDEFYVQQNGQEIRVIVKNAPYGSSPLQPGYFLMTEADTYHAGQITPDVLLNLQCS